MNKSIAVTKSEAVGLYGGNQAALAKALGIGRAAVSKWPDGPIPEVYALKIRFLLRPECFEKSA
jgi:predicted transcriptional regulator